jgi:predicted AAA+ superfamily ATPase
MFERALRLPTAGEETFFLWGPRQAGKTTLLRHAYPNVIGVDLLQSENFRAYTDAPEKLRQELSAHKNVRFVVIDEVQKVPALLDEIHWLIENTPVRFGLCGSSARKLKRGAANLLGGRALRYSLHGLVSKELGDAFDLNTLLNRGYMPRHYLSENYARMLEAYVADYLKEEIAAEGLVRRLPQFSRFLEIAALADTEILNYSTIGRDCGVSAPTVQAYYEILVDTLLGSYLPAYQKRPKRRTVTSPKFYFEDVGTVNFLARRDKLAPRSELFGKAFENWVFHELNAYRHYEHKMQHLSHWRLTTGVEVDFIVGDMEVVIEAKATERVTSDHLKGLRQIVQDYPEAATTRMLVSLEPRARKTDDGILLCPATYFAKHLWAGDFF